MAGRRGHLTECGCRERRASGFTAEQSETHLAPVSSWCGRGVFRSPVSRRAAQAAERGFRYLQVDGSPDSRPILGWLGFVELATTTPFVAGGG